MKEISATGLAINPELVRSAIIGTGKKPEIVRMHPAQLAGIAMLFEVVSLVNVKELKSLEDIEAIKKLANEYHPSTFMGMKIVQDASMRSDQMEFVDAAGEMIGKIYSLSVPLGFDVPR